ncbi:DNA polymerase III subunit beta, partial [Georgenia sp. 10Sc9-8]|nr:DNA polymerase III subunit beta [Georgenia halotolerans]
LSTDRYRLAMRELTWNPTSPDMSAVALVRARTLSDVAKSLTSAGTVDMALASEAPAGLIGFESGGRRTTSLLVDGDYPPVRRLFPESTTTHAVVSTSALVEAARRVSLVAERNTPIRLSFTEGQVVLEAGQGDDAQASEALEATLTGEEITTAFNPHYLLDGLGALSTPFVRMSFTHPSKPAVMSGQRELEGEDNPEFRYLLMPIRFAG